MSSLRLALSICASLGLCLPIASAKELITWDQTKASLSKYCGECHSDDLPDADLDITSIDQRKDLEANPQKWTRVLQALRTHYMPHPNGRNLPEKRRRELVSKITSELIALAADHQSSSAPLRRLNRTEFTNTLNDLLFVDGNWSQSLPADNAGYGFDNIAAALSISPLLIERYFDVASRIALVAVPQSMPSSEWTVAASSFNGGSFDKEIRVIYGEGSKPSAKHTLFFPGKGSYTLGLKLSAQQAGPENAFAVLYLNGKQIQRFEVTRSKEDPPETLEHTIQIDTPGEHAIEIRLAKDYFLETETGAEDRNLLFHGLKIEGPIQTQKDLQSRFLDRHFGSLPENLTTRKLKDGIHRFASRAYRRPLDAGEAEDLWKVFLANSDYLSDERDVRNGICAVIDAVLTTPSFLFRHEDPKSNNEFALATWLSYFIWSSMPDDRIFQLALKNELRDNLDTELQRILEDPKAVALAENFAGQWWRLRDLDIHKPDRSIYQNAHSQLLRDMKEETELLFLHVLKENRSLLEFLTADYTFINGPLARHYGIPDVKGKQFRKVSLKDTPRRGVWSQAGILTVTSYPNYTSPVLRGQWILENIMGLAPPPPPDNIPSLPNTTGNPNPSDLRASLASHRDNPDCASCHDIMDPFGLALEHYDAIGGLRSLDERAKITSEQLFDGVTIGSPSELADYFETERDRDFIKNMAHKLAIYAAGRGLEWRDEAAIERIVQHTIKKDYRFSELIAAVVDEFAPNQKIVSISQRANSKH